MSNILERIVETKRAEVAAAKLRRPMGELSAAVRDAGPVRNLFDAVIAKPNRRVGLIAEIKKKSPSAGLIRPDFDPVRLAQTRCILTARLISSRGFDKPCRCRCCARTS
mgnify:CR=1 FL=1